MTGFLDLVTHAAHDGGLARQNQGNGWVRIAEDVRGGQFDIAFCSVRCLRRFLGGYVDELKRQMASNRARKGIKLLKTSRK